MTVCDQELWHLAECPPQRACTLTGCIDVQMLSSLSRESHHTLLPSIHNSSSRETHVANRRLHYGVTQSDMIFVQNFTLPNFHAKNFTPQKCVICNIVHACYKSVNAFDICNFGIFAIIELYFTVFEEKKHKLMREPEICVLLSRENMFFLEKFTPLWEHTACTD